MIKYCLGVDVSKKDFHCCICVIDQIQKVTVRGSRKFSNNRDGFKELQTWLGKQHKDQSVPLVVVMEATGIYYEQLAFYLFRSGYSVSVVLPNKAKKYLQSIGIKSKNDKIDAQGLARMGAEQCLDPWQPMDTFFYELRALTRQHQNLQELKTSLGNQQHALEFAMYESKHVAKQLKALITTLDKQIAAMEEAIGKHIRSNSDVSQKVDNICEIKGVGLLTVAIVLAETNGFTLFKNSRQLVSYAGYDVVENQSGNHRGKTRISKKGNSRIRRGLHMSAFCVIRYEQTPFIGLFHRTLEKHGQKMKSYVAVQKKLLVLIYSIWKHNKPYEHNYEKNKYTGEMEQEPSSLLDLEQVGVEIKSSAIPEGGATQGRHTVEISQFASSLLKQKYA
jgi:transposase